jgi:hypothetical protein
MLKFLYDIARMGWTFDLWLRMTLGNFYYPFLFLVISIEFTFVSVVLGHWFEWDVFGYQIPEVPVFDQSEFVDTKNPTLEVNPSPKVDPGDLHQKPVKSSSFTNTANLDISEEARKSPPFEDVGMQPLEKVPAFKDAPTQTGE